MIALRASVEKRTAQVGFIYTQKSSGFSHKEDPARIGINRAVCPMSDVRNADKKIEKIGALKIEKNLALGSAARKSPNPPNEGGNATTST